MSVDVQAHHNGMEDEVPVLEAAEVPQSAKQSKRYAKAMSKMGLKPEQNIIKVNIRKVGSLSFAMSQPEVYRFPGTNTFVIFGEAQLEDVGALAQESAARAAVSGAAVGVEDGESASPAAVVEDDGEDEDIDAGDLEEKEITMVMSQASASRAKAIRALKNNNGDMVNAIMELTM